MVSPQRGPQQVSCRRGSLAPRTQENLLAAAAPSWTPLGELTALPICRSHSWWEGGCPSQKPHPSRSYIGASSLLASPVTRSRRLGHSQHDWLVVDMLAGRRTHRADCSIWTTKLVAVKRCSVDHMHSHAHWARDVVNAARVFDRDASLRTRAESCRRHFILRRRAESLRGWHPAARRVTACAQLSADNNATRQKAYPFTPS